MLMNKFRFQKPTSEKVFIRIQKIPIILILIIACTIFSHLNAQSKNIIKGTVVDTKGEYIIGANIMIKGTKKGTITDLNGKFTLDCPAKGTLVFSYLGFNKLEVEIDKSKELNIVMQENTKNLEEVVVIGYGTINKKDLTGSVAAVKMEDLQKNVGASFQEAMGGKIAGVQATSLSGKPGEIVDIVIRGGNSITQSNAPLYVVDGFPMTDDVSASLISPDDIESINILKDASATAIYGARGANGVIMITTKKGLQGKPSVQYNGYYGIQETNAKIDVLDPYEFVNLQLQISPEKATENYLTYRNMTLEDYKNKPKVNWQDHVFQQASIQNHYISVSGRMDRTLYSVSATYHNQSGVIITSGSKRYTSRVNLEQRFSDKFKVGVTGSYSVGTITGENPDSQSSYILESMWSTRPFFYGNETLLDMEEPLITDGNDYNPNPIANLLDTDSKRKTTSLSGNTFLDFEPLPGLRLRITGGLNQYSLDNTIFYGSRTSSAIYTANQVNGRLEQIVNNSYLNENTLNYSKTFNKSHKIDAVTGFTMSGRKSEGYVFGATNLPYESLGLSGLEDGIARKVNATSGEWHLMSYLGRFNYSYKSKYLFTTSFRADGSSKFSVDNRWAFFPSGSAAWVVSQEPFMKGLKNTISDFKIRASWGKTGNNNVSDFASRGQLLSNGLIYPFGGLVNNSAMIMSKMDNIALKWETTEQFDFGTELSLFKNKLKLEIDYYDKTTSDLLLNADLPFSSGYTRAEKNVGSIRNQGVEFTINSNIISKEKFDWDMNLNISTNKNTVLELADGQRSMTRSLTFFQFNDVPAYIALVGEPLSLMYGYISDGLLQESDFYKDASSNYSIKPDVAVDRPSVKPGFMKFKDLNNDGKIDANDRTIIGNANPLFTGGLNNTFKIYNFDLSLFIQWSYGNDILNGNKYAYTSAHMLNRNYSVDILKAWTPANIDTEIPVLGSQRGNLTYNSWMVEDGSYIRLKTLQLGYTLPSKLSKKMKISSIRFYTTFSNVFTLTNYSGFDPEVSTQFSNMTRGFDYSSYPRSLMAVFGANVKF